jgi:hypothetical protein
MPQNVAPWSGILRCGNDWFKVPEGLFRHDSFSPAQKRILPGCGRRTGRLTGAALQASILAKKTERVLPVNCGFTASQWLTKQI